MSEFVGQSVVIGSISILTTTFYQYSTMCYCIGTFSYFIYYFFAQGQYYGDGKNKETGLVTFKQNLFICKIEFAENT